jgi:hypothetical protein
VARDALVIVIMFIADVSKFLEISGDILDDRNDGVWYTEAAERCAVCDQNRT